MKEGAMAVGNHVLLVSTEIECVLKDAVAVCGRCVRRIPIGLYPRKAANKAVVGGIASSVEDNWGAGVWSRKTTVAIACATQRLIDVDGFVPSGILFEP